MILASVTLVGLNESGMLGNSEVSHAAAVTCGLIGAGRPAQDTHTYLADSRLAGRTSGSSPLASPAAQLSLPPGDSFLRG